MRESTQGYELSVEERRLFDQMAALRQQIFDIIWPDMGSIATYIRLVEDYDHTGTVEESLTRAIEHLTGVLERLNKGEDVLNKYMTPEYVLPGFLSEEDIVSDEDIIQS